MNHHVASGIALLAVAVILAGMGIFAGFKIHRAPKIMGDYWSVLIPMALFFLTIFPLGLYQLLLGL